MWLLFLGGISFGALAFAGVLNFLFGGEEQSSECREEQSDVQSDRKESHYYDAIGNRWHSRNQIRSELPYTKKKHFWLTDRSCSPSYKKSIEIVHDKINDILKVRYWFDDSIDGLETILDRGRKLTTVKLFSVGEQVDVTDDEAAIYMKYSYELFRFYCDSSPYVKNLNVEDFFEDYNASYSYLEHGGY